MSQEQTIERHLDTDRETPAIEITEVIAELEGTDVEELSAIWDCIDGAIDHIFSNPPSRGANVIVSFNYEGYRVTVSQTGAAWFERQESD